jgi:hypothetical protein
MCRKMRKSATFPSSNAIPQSYTAPEHSNDQKRLTCMRLR